MKPEHVIAGIGTVSVGALLYFAWDELGSIFNYAHPPVFHTDSVLLRISDTQADTVAAQTAEVDTDLVEIQQRIDADQQYMAEMSRTTHGIDRQCFEATMQEVDDLQTQLAEQEWRFKSGGYSPDELATMQETVRKIESKLTTANRLMQSVTHGAPMGYCA